MKKVFLVAIATVGFAFSGNAQETKFGVKAGVDLASVKGDVTVDTGFGVFTSEFSESYTGFFVGGFATIGISESFAVQPEVLYVSLQDDFSYLNVPIFAKFSFAEKFHAMAGPSLNYFLNAEEDEFKIGVDFGAAYDVTENLDINAKYTMGTGDIKVSGIFIGAGYTF